MGMFRRIAKDVARSTEAQSRAQEFADSLRLQLDGFQAGLDPNSQYFERASAPEYLIKLSSASERKRDAATKLNLHGYAAAFSSIHCRTFLRIHKGTLLGESKPEVTFGKYGCKELHSLHSDIRYLAWGVNQADVNPLEYWECKEMVDLYQSRVIEFAKSKLESGNLQILNDFNFPATIESVLWSSYEQMLHPPTNLYVPNVPPIAR